LGAKCRSVTKSFRFFFLPNSSLISNNNDQGNIETTMVSRRDLMQRSASARTFPRFLRRQESSSSRWSVQSTDSTNKSCPRPSRRRIRVRFDFDENDAVRATVHEYDGRTEEEKELCFGSKDEMKQQKKDAVNEALDCARGNTKYVESLELLFNTPLKSNREGCSMEEEQEAIRILGESTVRGLETRINPLINRHMQWALCTVLSRQAQLRKQSRNQMETCEMLRLCCEKVNMSTAELARKYAMADDMEAQKIYKEIATNS
jgi:hypothetical protein